ncbi:MAG: signal peptide peptidase SppA [Nitrospinaceae bacterium]|jgi:protease IV|nr:signal peptide peptidase SppA [Nitrospinaceae bacterium]MBT3434441.1 signal peptide peptidase SppA [Nitrospinaceae bacterium]MBT3823325.1 signal peptide peptidase SppA [Nitrospinaceae bacterium]MBT4092605.1 signal peptide peptidase SppA [Nitrospinaceae bacterium]MBT4431902.1 signal peptide peptidase SppA [Nitrospinaceae bacterium]
MKAWRTPGFLISVCLFLAIAVGMFGISRLLSGGDADDTSGFSLGFGDKDVVGLVRIKGNIFDAKKTVDSLTKMRRSSRVKSLLLRIDSPGGAVAPTQEIYEEVQRFRKTGRKVVASLGSVAASGGYYIASAADKIFSYPGTVTGSIGVIVVLPNAEKMLGKLGLSFNVIKSAPHKDMGSPLRPMTDEDRKIFQNLIDDTYEQFVAAVSRGRNMSVDRARKIADGSVYSGERAMKLGLVDSLGSQWDAALEAARFAKIEGEPRLFEIKSREGFLGMFNKSVMGWLNGGASSYFGGSPVMLQYMWR